MDDDQWVQERPAGVRWGLPEAFGVIGLMIAFLVASFWLPIPGYVVYAIVLVAVYLVIRFRGTGNPMTDLGLVMLPRDLLFGLVIAIAGRLIFVLAAILGRAFTGSSPQSGNLDIPRDDVGLLVLTFLFVAIAAPVTEEVITRGMLLRAVMWRGLRTGSSRPAGVAIAVSALVFGALHLPQALGDPALMVSLFLGSAGMGALLGLATVRTGRLGPAIVGHSLFNASSMLLGLGLGS